MGILAGYEVHLEDNIFVLEESSSLLSESLTIKEIAAAFFNKSGVIPSVDVKIKQFDVTGYLTSMLPKIFCTESQERCKYIPMWLQSASNTTWTFFCSLVFGAILPSVTIGQHNINESFKLWMMALVFLEIPINFGHGLAKMMSNNSIYCVDFVGSSKLTDLKGVFKEFEALEKDSIHEVLLDPLPMIKKAIKKVKKGLDSKRHRVAARRPYSTRNSRVKS